MFQKRKDLIKKGVGLCTRMRRSRRMTDHPRIASAARMDVKFVKNPCQISTKEEPLNLRPKRPLICVEATVNAAA